MSQKSLAMNKAQRIGIVGSGGIAHGERKKPGRAKYGDIVLEKGIPVTEAEKALPADKKADKKGKIATAEDFDLDKFLDELGALYEELLLVDSISVTKRSGKTGRDSQTGETIRIPDKKVVKFKAGSELAKKVK